jgi:hypothetical protein
MAGSILGTFAAVSGASDVTTGSRTSVAGSLITIHCAAWHSSAPVITLSDNKSNTITTTSVADGSDRIAQGYNASGTRGATHTVSAGFDNTSGCSLVGLEWDGIEAAPTVVTNTATGSSTAPSVSATAGGSPTSTYIGTMSYGGSATTIAPAGGASEGAEVDEGSNNQDLAVAYKVGLSGAQSVAWTLGASRGWGAVIQTFTEAGGAGGTVNDKVLESTLAISDQGLDYVFYNRVLESSLVVFDQLVSILSGITTKVLESAIVVTDGALFSVLRNRFLQDTIIISEGGTDQFITTNMVVDDTLDVVDELLRFARFYRVATDNVTVTDSIISAVINYVIISSVLTSNLTITDQALRYAFFTRTLESFLSLADTQLTAIQRFILLSDVLSVDDGAVATYVPSVGPATYDPLIRIGFDQPKIDIGGHAVN